MSIPSSPVSLIEERAVVKTPIPLSSVFDKIEALGVDAIIAKVVYEIDWAGKGKMLVHGVTNITRLQANLLAYIPAAKVGLGVCRVSVVAVQLLGLACFGIASGGAGASATAAAAMGTLKQGLVEVAPMVFGAGFYLADHAPPPELVLSDLKVSQDRLETLKQHMQATASEAFVAVEDPDLTEYNPWAQKVMKMTRVVSKLASDGTQRVATYAAWGQVFVGAGAIVVSPWTGGASFPFGITALLSGGVAIGAGLASGLIKDLKIGETVAKVFDSDEETRGLSEMEKLDYFVSKGPPIEMLEDLGAVYEVLAPSGGGFSYRPFSFHFRVRSSEEDCVLVEES